VIPPTALRVSGARFRATYAITGPHGTARGRAETIAVEQTIEFPADLIADDDIRRHVIGRIESVDAAGPERSLVRISYAVETSGGELPQLLNVLFGNCSLYPGVRLVDLELPPELLRRLPGPRFGVPGLRALLGIPTRPLLTTALKPMGLGAPALAQVAETLARGGIDVIKDDHGLANQPFAPWEQRVRACAAAVRRANEATGGRSLYMPSLNGPADEIAERARIARDAGAGGLLVLPGLAGLDTMRWLAASDEIGLPIMGHPAFMGSFVIGEDAGIEHGLLFGTIFRLAGADMVVFPSFGGRFSFSRDACASIARACRSSLGTMAPIFPAPGGGMTLARIDELAEFYGPDTALLVGGDLHRGDLAANVARMRAAVEGPGRAHGATPSRDVSTGDPPAGRVEASSELSDERREFLAEVAWLHHEHGLRQDEIARRFAVSRSTISRALSDAERVGIIQVVVSVPIREESRLSAELAARLGIAATVGIRAAGETSASAVALAAARLVERVAGTGSQTIAASWGRTLAATARLVRPRSTTSLRVVDAIGHAGGEQMIPAVDVTRTLGAALGATIVHLPSPAFVEPGLSREALIAAPTVAAALEAARQADVTLVSVGVAGTESLLLAEGWLSSAEMDRLVAAGATGEILGHFYDSAGREVRGVGPAPVGLSLDDLRASRRVIGVAGGAAKSAALAAAVEGGIVHEVVVDDDLARTLLPSGMPVGSPAGRAVAGGDLDRPGMAASGGAA